MAKFIYEAKSGPLEKVSGRIEAKSRSQAIALVEEKGLFPIQVKEVRENAGAAAGLIRRRISREELAVFTRQFSNLIESGLTITRALNVLMQQTAQPALKNIIMGIYERIKDGATLSDALSFYPKQFSQFYCAVVKAGELSGALEAVLNRLADFSEQEEKIRSDVLSALTYPALILSVGIITIYALLTFVVPKITAMFEEMGEVLPLPTQILINLSNIFKAYWWLALLLIAASWIFIKRNKSCQERLFWHRLILNLPLLGRIIEKTEIAHFARTLGLLFESGVAMLVGLEAVSETITNEVIKTEIKKITTDIKDGASLSSAIKKCSFFPLSAANIINVGEEAGTLEKSLKRIALSYEQELNRIIKALTSLLEPIMILLLGLVVTFIVVAMLLPIFQINFMVR
ncbi:MAG: hypothetical protein A3J51_00785 [Omnitrophica WOR_2 bacterium RIFCSPHIGHO2_02_FULL_45_21]|nr:MAG: hypothetical protein A3J51_00785 [Omnitrophica WOR_2 bacterium RIFCSPHIGHO2_02_FULL_45_21]